MRRIIRLALFLLAAHHSLLDCQSILGNSLGLPGFQHENLSHSSRIGWRYEEVRVQHHWVSRKSQEHLAAMCICINALAEPHYVIGGHDPFNNPCWREIRYV